MALLSALAGQLALVTQNAEMLQHLESSYFSTVTALASAVEAKDGYTADHCRLIAGMAEVVGRRMGLSDADLRLLRYAAILHDIGKAGVPGSVLRSPAPLTDEQSALIADHTVNGESIVARIQYLSPVAPIIRAAHERWDGAGYPDRLRGDEIPLAARIVFVCDSCHAMVSDRPYRKALTHEAAFAELLDNAGAQFDPAVVEAFVASRDAIERLLMKGPGAAQQAGRVLATVLFTDIVGSTGKAAEMGDTAYRDLLDRHHATVRALLRTLPGQRDRHGGRRVPGDVRRCGAGGRVRGRHRPRARAARSRDQSGLSHRGDRGDGRRRARHRRPHRRPGRRARRTR